MASVKGAAHAGVSAATMDGLSHSNSRRSSRSMLDGNKTGRAAAKEASSIRLGAAHDLPSSVAHFLYLSSSSSASSTAAAAKKQLRRQLLVLRDYCVSAGNKTKDKELLSQGGRHISRKIEATPEFNSCLDVIFATSLVFTSETEDVAKDTLRSIVAKLKAVQDTGDERAFRSAVVEVVNRILLCTPLAPPARDPSATTPASDSPSAKEAQRQAQAKSGRKKHPRPAAAAAEPKLRDECLDFLTVEDGTPVLLERVWKRWLNYFEHGYVRYVEKLRAEQQRSADAAAAAAHDDDEDNEDEDGHGEDGDAAESGDAAASQVPVIAAVPFFTARQSYWKSTTSAYAQFCYLLLAIYFVRTKDFSLNYLARVTKLVQYYAYQLESEDSEPIAVKEGAAAHGDESEEDDEEDGDAYDDEDDAEDQARSATPHAEPEEEEEVAALPAASEDEEPSQSEAAVQTDTPEPEQPAAAEEAAEVRSLPTTPKPEEAERAATPPPAKPVRQRRRGHKCYPTQELPEELRPSTELAAAEETEAAARDSDEHSHVPVVRLTEHIDLPDASQSRSRARAAPAVEPKTGEAEADTQGQTNGHQPEEIAKDDTNEAEAETME